MSVPMSMGPMLVMESRQANGTMYHHGTHHMQQPGPPPPPPPLPPAPPLIPNGTHLLPQFHHSMQHHGSSSVAAPSGQHIITSSMNRSQRCGVCRGCQCKPCGQCTYCQDSPQFGGPGVKKQSCIERRCLRVLENRLQRDAPTFKARVGCNQCEDCRMPDCQICLVCLDKRFFDNRYMTGAMCAKKRCNNATSIELPAAQNVELRQAHKRTYEQSGMLDYQMMKRRVHPSLEQLGTPQQQQQQQQRLLNMSQPQTAVLNGGPGCTASTPPLYVGPQMRLVPPQAAATPQQQLLIAHQQQQQHPGTTTIAPTSSAARGAETTVVVSTTTQVTVPVPNPSGTAMQPGTNNSNNGATVQVVVPQPQQHMTSRSAPQQYIPHLPQPHPVQHPYLIASASAAGPGAPYFLPSYIEESVAPPQSDPFTPPSYAPEMKNVVVLQPL